MDFPRTLNDILLTIGQAAIELPSHFDGYREFVTVARFETSRMHGFAGQFPHLVQYPIGYRLMRFRVDSSIIRDDRHCCNDDLIGLESIHVGEPEDVMRVLEIWNVQPETLLPPSATAVPV